MTQSNEYAYSLYIPRMKNFHTNISVVNCLRHTNIGVIERIDFIQIEPKTTSINDTGMVLSAFVHFSIVFNEHNSIIQNLNNGGSFKLFLNDNEYWLLLKAKNVIPRSRLNIHQLTENQRLLEKKVFEQQEEIKALQSVTNQLIGGLYNQRTQGDMIDIHRHILELCVDKDFKERESKSKWKMFPTTRQGDYLEKKVTQLESLIRVIADSIQIQNINFDTIPLDEIDVSDNDENDENDEIDVSDNDDNDSLMSFVSYN